MADRFKSIEELEQTDQWVGEVLCNFVYDLIPEHKYWHYNVQQPMILKLANYLYDMGKKGE